MGGGHSKVGGVSSNSHGTFNVGGSLMGSSRRMLQGRWGLLVSSNSKMGGGVECTWSGLMVSIWVGGLMIMLQGCASSWVGGRFISVITSCDL